jgi:hypothetical protein
MQDLTHIRIKTATDEVELEGTRDFVEEHLEFFRRHGAIPAGPATSAGSRSERPSADAFLHGLGIASGKTAVQDYILAFGYYVTQIQRRPSFSVEDLDFHFAHAGIRPPRNLANTLGNLKRKRGCIERGEQRGTYVLNTDGIRYVESLRQ